MSGTIDMTNYEAFADVENGYSNVEESATLYICGTCGAVVSDARVRDKDWASGVEIHDEWHKRPGSPAVRDDERG